MGARNLFLRQLCYPNMLRQNAVANVTEFSFSAHLHREKEVNTTKRGEYRLWYSPFSQIELKRLTRKRVLASFR